MISETVELEKPVKYDTLEVALVKAAEECGLQAEVKDNYRENYRLGREDVIAQEYIGKEIKLKKLKRKLFGRKLYSFLEVSVFDREKDG